MRLQRARRAFELAQLAVREFDDAARIQDDSGGNLDYDHATIVEFRLLEALAMIRRIGPIVYSESKGHRRPDFSEWWEATGNNQLHKQIASMRNAEFKRGDITLGTGATTIIYADNPDDPSGTTDDPRVIARNNPSDTVSLLRKYLVWCGEVLIPGAEQRLL